MTFKMMAAAAMCMAAVGCVSAPNALGNRGFAHTRAAPYAAAVPKGVKRVAPSKSTPAKPYRSRVLAAPPSAHDAPVHATTSDDGASIALAGRADPLAAEVAPVGFEPIQAQLDDYEKIALELNTRRFMRTRRSGGLVSPILHPYSANSYSAGAISMPVAAGPRQTRRPVDPPRFSASLSDAVLSDASREGPRLAASAHMKVTSQAASEPASGARWESEGGQPTGPLQLDDADTSIEQVAAPVTLRGRFTL